MNARPLALFAAAGVLVTLAACTSGANTRSPTTEVYHPLDPNARINDHAQRLADGVARWREVKQGGLPLNLRDLALTMAADGEPCFTEILKDHWYHPYAYVRLDERSGRFALVSAGQNGGLGDGDDLHVERGPGDPRVRTYGYTWHMGE
jgi:hypothetical protein